MNRQNFRQGRAVGIIFPLLVLLALLVPQFTQPSSTPAVLAADTTITGAITGCGTPLTDYEITVYQSYGNGNVGNEITATSIITDTDGSFSFTFDDASYTLPMSVTVVASRPGYKTTQLVNSFPGTNGEWNIASGDTTDVGTHNLDNATFTLAGTVWDNNSDGEYGYPPTDENMQRLADATVELTITPDSVYGGPEMKVTTTTDANGYFTVQQYITGTGTLGTEYSGDGAEGEYYVRVTARKDGFVRQSQTWYINIPSCGNTITHNPELTPGYTIKGTFKDALTGDAIPVDHNWYMGLYDNEGDGVKGYWCYADGCEISYSDLTSGNQYKPCFARYSDYPNQCSYGDKQGLDVADDIDAFTLGSVRGVTNLGDVKLRGVRITGKFSDLATGNPIADDNISVDMYDEEGNNPNTLEKSFPGTSGYPAPSSLSYITSSSGSSGEYQTNKIFPPSKPVKLLFRNPNGYFGHFYTSTPKDVKEGDYFFETAQTLTIPTNKTELSGIDMYFDKGRELQGTFYDKTTGKKIASSWVWVNLSYPEGKGTHSLPGDMYAYANTDPDSEDFGTYTLDRLPPVSLKLEFANSSFTDGTKDTDDNRIYKNYIGHFYTPNELQNSDYYEATAQTLVIPAGTANYDALEGKDVSFEQCATLKGTVSAGGADNKMTYNEEATVTDFYPADDPRYPSRDWTWWERGYGYFDTWLYDPQTGDHLTGYGPRINPDGSFALDVCNRTVATLGKFKVQFGPNEVRTVNVVDKGNYAVDEEGNFTGTYPTAEATTTNYRKDFVSYYHGSSGNGYSLKDATVLSLGPGDEVAVTVNFERGGVISGKVTDEETGEPIDPTNAPSVSLYRADTLQKTKYTESLEDDGTYTFKNVPPGEYMVKFSANSYTSEYYNDRFNVEDATSIVVAASNGEEPNTYTADAALAKNSSLAVQLLDKDTNEPILDTNFTLTLYDVNSGTTEDVDLKDIDKTGVHTFTNVTPGTYQLFVSGWGYEDQWYDGHIGGSNKEGIGDDIVIKPKEDKQITTKLQGVYGKGTISGQVVREDTGAPIAWATVGLYDSFSGTWLKSWNTDSQGKYTLENILDGE
jgi:hypothetical protein